MVKSVFRGSGEPPVSSAHFKEKTPHKLSGVSVFSLAPDGTRSKAGRDLSRMMDIARGFLASGSEVTEDTLYWVSSSRYKKGDCLRALRVLHRCYPRNTHLFLQGGIYVLAPVISAEVHP